jgi:peroxiredoxin
MNKNPNRQVIIGVSVIVGICLICCVGGGIVAVLGAPALSGWAFSQIALEVGAAAPDFELESLDGETVSLSQFRGQPVLLSFGATWCAPCRAEVPIVQKAHENHPELIVLLVDSDESAGIVQDFVEKYRITHSVLLDENSLVYRTYRINGIPTSFFIDENGVIREINVGQLTSSVLAEKLSTIGVAP